MSLERVRLKGMLADLKNKAKKLKAEAQGHVALIRLLLNPWENNPDSIDVEQALKDMTRLKEIVDELREVNAKIKKMTEEEDL